MLTQITLIWNKAKYWIIACGLGILYLIGYHAGKTKEQVKTMKGTLDEVKNSKKSRDTLSDSDRIKRLHNKYKR